MHSSGNFKWQRSFMCLVFYLGLVIMDYKANIWALSLWRWWRQEQQPQRVPSWQGAHNINGKQAGREQLFTHCLLHYTIDSFILYTNEIQNSIILIVQNVGRRLPGTKHMYYVLHLTVFFIMYETWVLNKHASYKRHFLHSHACQVVFHHFKPTHAHTKALHKIYPRW